MASSRNRKKKKTKVTVDSVPRSSVAAIEPGDPILANEPIPPGFAAPPPNTFSIKYLQYVLSKYRDIAIPALILILSLGVYGTLYGQPKLIFWDENYHITSAQKHIDNVMYMETHPPLGKLLIALGEVVVGVNSELDKSKLLSTDHISGNDLPPDMKMTGFRLPSTFMMAFSVLFFYGIVRRITKRRWVALGFTSLIIFDNALIVHSRAAMLEGIQMFFILAALYYWVRTITDNKSIRLPHYAILGVLIGLVVSVKLNGAVLLLLFVMLYGVDQWENIRKLDWNRLIKRLGVTAPAGVLPLMAVVFSVFYIHIALGTQIVDNRTYKASPEYLNYIREGKAHTLSAFIVGMQDNWRFISEYSDGVPRLDRFNPEENGSYAMGWPVGNKSINYRWDKSTVDGQVQVHYKQMIGNPIVWLSVLIGIILSVSLIIGRFIYGNAVKDGSLFYWVVAFTTLYCSYMIAILQIERVMYIYHYLVPLVFGMINLALVFTYIYRDEVLADNRHAMINLGVFAVLVIGVFAFFSPFTYGFPMTEDDFMLRDWFSFWRLNVVR